MTECTPCGQLERPWGKGTGDRICTGLTIGKGYRAIHSSLVHISMYVAGTVGTILVREMSLFQYACHVGILTSKVVPHTSLCTLLGQQALSTLERYPYF